MSRPIDAGAAVRVVVCPTCKGPSRFATDNRWRPFCSERCRSMDLGAWASESYRVDGQPPAEAEPPPPQSPTRESH